MRSRPSFLLAWPILAAALGACSENDSYVVVKLVAGDGEAPFEKIVQLHVVVEQGSSTTDLYFPRQPTAALTIGDGSSPSFSVSFKNRSGQLGVVVHALAAGGAEAGCGGGTASIVREGVASVTVPLGRGCSSGDGGTDGAASDAGDARGPDGSGGDAGAACPPTEPASCGPGMTCAISCAAMEGLCTEAGGMKPGAVCASSADCAPGSSCFDLGCGVRACVAYCRSDADCGAGRCASEITCGGAALLARICSLPCDPTGSARAGCPAGLACLIFENEVPDCACPESTRTGGDGAACTDSRGCRPGFHCVDQGGAMLCRQVCRLGSAGDCPPGKTCAMLANYMTYGACL